MVRFLASAGAMIGVAVAVNAGPMRQGDPVSWDARIELVSLMFHLAGAPEYSTNKVPLYSSAVAAFFGGMKDHAAVTATRELRDKHRIAFFHPMNFAVHVTNPPALAERTPFTKPGSAIGPRWQAAPYPQYLDHLRAFYRDARVSAFFAAQASLYETTTRRLRAAVAAEVDEAWFREYFGSGPSMRFHVVPSLLNGGAQYGATFRGDDGEEAYAVMGAFKIDAEGVPVFDRDDADNVVHEYAHTLTSRFVESVLPQLEASGPVLFERVRSDMRAQSYGTWQTMVHEQVVRAVVVRSIRARRGEAAALAEIAAQEKLGFAQTRALSAVLADYERSRATRRSFADILPEVVAVFKGAGRP